MKIKILCLILLIVSSVSVFSRGSREISGSSSDKVEQIITEEYKVTGDQLLDIDIKVGGDIQVYGWEKDVISVEVKKRGRDYDLCEVDFSQHNNRFELIADVSGRGNIRCSISVKIYVPLFSSVSFSTMGGDIILENLNGDFKGTTMGGDIVLKNLKGYSKIKTMGGDIEAYGCILSGSVLTMGGDIGLHDVQGDVEVKTMGGETEYFSDYISISGVVFMDSENTNPLKISSMGGPITIDNAPNGIEAETMGGDIEVKSAGTYAILKTMGGDIDVKSLDGSIEAETMGGDVDVIMVGDLLSGVRDVTLTSLGGDIILTVPEGLSMEVEIVINITKNSKKHYKIKSDFDIDIEEKDVNEAGNNIEKRLIGTASINGSKNKIRIETTNGNITIRKGK